MADKNYKYTPYLRGGMILKGTVTVDQFLIMAVTDLFSMLPPGYILSMYRGLSFR